MLKTSSKATATINITKSEKEELKKVNQSSSYDLSMTVKNNAGLCKIYNDAFKGEYEILHQSEYNDVYRVLTGSIKFSDSTFSMERDVVVTEIFSVYNKDKKLFEFTTERGLKDLRFDFTKELLDNIVKNIKPSTKKDLTIIGCLVFEIGVKMVKKSINRHKETLETNTHPVICDDAKSRLEEYSNTLKHLEELHERLKND